MHSIIKLLITQHLPIESQELNIINIKLLLLLPIHQIWDISLLALILLILLLLHHQFLQHHYLYILSLHHVTYLLTHFSFLLNYFLSFHFHFLFWFLHLLLHLLLKVPFLYLLILNSPFQLHSYLNHFLNRFKLIKNFFSFRNYPFFY